MKVELTSAIAAAVITTINFTISNMLLFTNKSTSYEDIQAELKGLAVLVVDTYYCINRSGKSSINPLPGGTTSAACC